MFELYKFIKIFIYPLTLALLLQLISLMFLLSQPSPSRLRFARISGCIAIVLLYLLSTGPISSLLIGVLEQAYPSFHPVHEKTFDAIVVLSADQFPKSGVRPDTELTYATIQRTLCGAKAYRQQLSSKLVLSGGTTGSGEPDALEMARLAEQLAIPREAMVLEEASRNTYEEARELRRLLGPRKKILLVTSAFHIPRAVLLFENRDFLVTAYPCGYRTAHKVWTMPSLNPIHLLPSTSSLERSTLAINEFIGLVIYQLVLSPNFPARP